LKTLELHEIFSNIVKNLSKNPFTINGICDHKCYFISYFIDFMNDIKKEIAQAEKARDQEKKDLAQARDKYDDYMANRAKEEPVKVAKEKPAESKQNNADNNSPPKAAPAPQVVAIQSAPKVSVTSGSGGGGGGGGGKRK
jgi:hypothetical protein